jgi:N-acetylglucosaminyldiphosphoundecaprenol N-acetyl-beta-D-mannosaminyltransferase
MSQIVDFAGVAVDNVTLKEAADRLESFIAERFSRLVVTPNPEMIVCAQTDPELKSILNSADLRVPDGISMIVVSKIMGNPLKERVSGIDLLQEMLKRSARKGYKIFLLGGAQGVGEEARQKIELAFPDINIVGVENGYFGEDSKVIAKIKACRPDLLFVGLGAGRQEKWINHHRGELKVPVSVVIGGSLDVISGRKRRAPVWIQKLYIEWLYRLITEPERWKRQLALPKFLWLVFTRSLR